TGGAAGGGTTGGAAGGTTGGAAGRTTGGDSSGAIDPLTGQSDSSGGTSGGDSGALIDSAAVAEVPARHDAKLLASLTSLEVLAVVIIPPVLGTYLHRRRRLVAATLEDRVDSGPEGKS
ncbi:MAG: hypothetical protein HOV87_27660, partial [Catenulispora sp.]|nr:hypothetical protein [Catenulispora sp.]